MIRTADPLLIENLASDLTSGASSSQAEWLQHCFQETHRDRGFTLISMDGDIPIGAVSVLYTATYPHFAQQNIPEIHNLVVLPSYQRKGRGVALLKAAEEALRQKNYNQIGLGVGITQDYQAAFGLYTGSGYKPDGKGLYHAKLPHQFVRYGDTITVDNSTTLWLIKRI